MGEGTISTMGFEILLPQESLCSSLGNGLKNLKALSNGFNTWNSLPAGAYTLKKKILHRESAPETMPSKLSNSCGMIQDNCLAYKKNPKKKPRPYRLNAASEQGG